MNTNPRSHQIEISGFIADTKYLDHTVAFSTGPIRKELALRTDMRTMTARWVVKRAGKIVKTTKSVAVATKAYNAI